MLYHVNLTLLSPPAPSLLRFLGYKTVHFFGRVYCFLNNLLNQPNRCGMLSHPRNRQYCSLSYYLHSRASYDTRLIHFIIHFVLIMYFNSLIWGLRYCIYHEPKCSIIERLKHSSCIPQCNEEVNIQNCIIIPQTSLSEFFPEMQQAVSLSTHTKSIFSLFFMFFAAKFKAVIKSEKRAATWTHLRNI